MPRYLCSAPRSEENIGKATNGGARAAHDASLSRLKHWLLRVSGFLEKFWGPKGVSLNGYYAESLLNLPGTGWTRTAPSEGACQVMSSDIGVCRSEEL